jgi:hypothetical protein
MRQRSCKSASLSSLFHPPSRANFKGTKKSFCIGGEKDSFESLTRNHPSSVGTTWLKKAAEARGNSAQSIQSLFRLSGFSERPPVAHRWVVGERTPPRRTGLRPRRPVGPGRRCWAFGGQGARRSAPPVGQDSASRRRGRDEPGQGNGTTELSVAGGSPGSGQVTRSLI